MTEDVAILILAAGSSERLGTPKQLLPYKNTTLLRHTIEQVMGLNASKIYVVLGAFYEEIHASIQDLPIDILKNDQWKSGMSSAIRLGVEHIQRDQNIKRILITLTDLPLLDTFHYKNLLQAHQFQPSNITATQYTNSKGVPVIFNDMYFDTLEKLVGEEGAKPILKQHKSDVAYWEANIAYFDVDTTDAYLELLSL